MRPALAIVEAMGHPPGVIPPEDRPAASHVRILKARRDPHLVAKLRKAAATLAAMSAHKHKSLARDMRDAIEFCQATGADLPERLEEMGILARIYGRS